MGQAVIYLSFGVIILEVSGQEPIIGPLLLQLENTLFLEHTRVHCWLQLKEIIDGFLFPKLQPESELY